MYNSITCFVTVEAAGMTGW